jgi:ankyrin repeat protein
VRQQKRNGVLDPDFQKQVAAEKRARLDVIDMLIENGASLNTQTVNGETPFSLALKENQIDVLHKFVDNVKLSESPMLFHHFTSHLLDERYHKLLVQMMQKENLTAEVTNVLNKDGFTPFLAYIKHFTEQVDMLEMAITRELLYAEWK